MDPNNIDTGRWKSPDFRMKVVKRITDALMEKRPSPEITLPQIVKSVERFEEKVNTSAKSEGEYIAMVIAKVKAIYSQPQIESKLLLPNPSGSGEVFSAPGKDANKEWQEQTYQKVQQLKSQYLRILDSLYQKISNKLQEHESSPQESKTIDMERFKQIKKVLEYIFALFRVSKSEITANTKGRVDLAEKYIQHLLKNASSHQGKHSADLQSKQQFGPSRSRISQKVINEMRLSPQVLETQKNQLTMKISQQNDTCLQEHQVAIQFINSQQDINQLSTIKGHGNTVKQQPHFAKATEAFGVSINTVGISASPLIKDGTNINKISHKPTLVSEEPSAAMQRLIKALTSISPEALSASVGEIGEVICMSDAIPMPKLIDEPPQMEGETQPSLISEGWEMLLNAMPFDTEKPDLNSVASKLIDEPPHMEQETQPSLIPEGWKMSRSIDAMPFDASRICASACDGFNQLIDAEDPDLNSFTSKVKRPRIVENCNLFEEIKEINNLLIDSEVVIGAKDNIESEAGVATEHNEGLVVKFLFNAVTVNQNLVSHFTADKKSLIKPLWLLVPTSYPLSSPIILDKLPLEVSEDLRDLSLRAKAKLRFYLQSLDQPWSLKVIARSWERYAREAIIEYAQAHGGGTFSSRYGAGWEVCRF